MRARNLKPSLFKNEVLGVADPLFTVTYEGLWCLADREGRLEDRPARIHVEINPWRPLAETERALAWLAEQGFIERYEVDGTRYLWIPKFRKHQQPHIREKPSTIPAPCQHGASTVREAGGNEAGPSESSFLNPSSLKPETGNLNEDSTFRNPETSTTRRAVARGQQHPKRAAEPRPTAEQVEAVKALMRDPRHAGLRKWEIAQVANVPQSAVDEAWRQVTT